MLFTFECIRNIPENQKFSKPIKIINILEDMLRGDPLLGIKPVHSDIAKMSTMIKAELDAVYLDDPYTAKLPLYSVHLFHQFLNQKTEIIINWEAMGYDFIYHDERFDRDFYGFKKFRPLFVTGNGSGNLKISYIVNLVQNAESFVVMSVIDEYIPSIALDDVFLSEILSSIKSRNERGSSKFKEFVIVSPSDSIPYFINLNQQRFNRMGWRLTRKMYSHPRRPGQAPNSLWITKM